MEYNLIADAGSTKIDWALTDLQGGKVTHFTTRGLNALLATADQTESLMRETASFLPETSSLTAIWYYGAGCATPEICDRMRSAIRAILKADEIIEARKVVRQVYLDEKIERYIVDIVFATRFPEKYDLKELKDMIGFGGSPRASINLALAARTYAFIKRRGYVIPEDVRAVAHDVLRHRIGLTYEAEANNMTSDEIISKILNKVEVPTVGCSVDFHLKAMTGFTASCPTFRLFPGSIILHTPFAISQIVEILSIPTRMVIKIYSSYFIVTDRLFTHIDGNPVDA